MNNFNVGDIILYGGNSSEFAPSEFGRLQKIECIDGDCYYTMFLDNGEINSFHYDSDYFNDCVFVDGIGRYNNGVPVLWEDGV